MQNPWNFFDAIYCINLKKEIERRKKVQFIFDHYGISVTFFEGILDENKNKGCLYSHKNIYNLALSKGYNNILIFEDDIIPTKEISRQNLEYYTNFIRKNRNCDIFYLGAIPDCLNYSQKKVQKKIYKIRGICTHAYALNKNALQKLKDIEYTPEMPLDYIIKLNLECFSGYPSFFYQETGYNLPEEAIIF